MIPAPNISKLFMIDASNGWAIGDAYILRTYDGGATWYSVTPRASLQSEMLLPERQQGLGTNHRFDLPHTWMAERTLGPVQVPFNGGYIQFLDDSNGFVLSGEGSRDA